MRKFLVLAFVLTFVSCVSPYKPTCEVPNLGDFSGPDEISGYYDTQWGDLAVVLNTNISASYCYGYLSFSSPLTGTVKIIPVAKDNGKTILSGLAVDKEKSLAFVGERTERKFYVSDLKTGETVISFPINYEVLKVYFYKNFKWGDQNIDRAVIVLSKGGHLGIWDEDQLLKGKAPLEWVSTNITYPGDLYVKDNYIYVLPYTSGTFVKINLSDKTQSVYFIPYPTTSWYGTDLSWCKSADMLCFPVNSEKELLFFDTENDDWGGREKLDGMLFKLIDDGEVKIFSYFSPPEIIVEKDGVKKVVYTPKNYSNIMLMNSYLYISDFGNNKFVIKKVK